jgi:hypothetical protein
MAVRRGGEEFAEGRDGDQRIGKADLDGEGEGDEEEQDQEQQRRQDEQPMRMPAGQQAVEGFAQRGAWVVRFQGTCPKNLYGRSICRRCLRPARDFSCKMRQNFLNERIESTGPRLSPLVAYRPDRNSHRRFKLVANIQKFFGSFFQKRTERC